MFGTFLLRHPVLFITSQCCHDPSMISVVPVSHEDSVFRILRHLLVDNKET